MIELGRTYSIAIPMLLGTATACARHQACEGTLGFSDRHSPGHALTISDSIRAGAIERLRVQFAESPLLVHTTVDGYTLLTYAAKLGQTEISSLLVDAGASIDALDPSGWSAMGRAAESGHLSLVSMLLDRGAAPSSGSRDHESLVYLLASQASSELIGRALACGAEFDERSGFYGRTPLYVAAAAGQGATVQQLLRDGARLGSRDCRGRTAAHAAAENGNLPVMIALQGACADWLVQDSMGNTPLHEAARNGHTNALAFLLTRGKSTAMLRAANNHAWTALHAAAARGHLECVELLLRLEEASDTTDIGQTVLHLSAVHGHLDTYLHLSRSGLIPQDTRDSFGCSARDYLQLQLQHVSCPNPVRSERLREKEELERLSEHQRLGVGTAKLAYARWMPAHTGQRSVNPRGFALWEDGSVLIANANDSGDGTLQVGRVGADRVRSFVGFLRSAGLFDWPTLGGIGWYGFKETIYCHADGQSARYVWPGRVGSEWWLSAGAIAPDDGLFDLLSSLRTLERSIGAPHLHAYADVFGDAAFREFQPESDAWLGGL